MDTIEQILDTGIKISNLPYSDEIGLSDLVIFSQWNDDQKKYTSTCIISYNDLIEDIKTKIITNIFIVFDGNGGLSPEHVKCKPGTLVHLPEISRVGYQFLGWFTKKTGGDQISEPFYPTESMILYAHWEAMLGALQYFSNFGGK